MTVPSVVLLIHLLSRAGWVRPVIRAEKGWNHGLAERLSVSPADGSIHRKWKVRPEPALAFRIARLFGVLPRK